MSIDYTSDHNLGQVQWIAPRAECSGTYRRNRNTIGELGSDRSSRRKGWRLHVLTPVVVDHHRRHNVHGRVGALKKIQGLGVVRRDLHLGDEAEESNVAGLKGHQHSMRNLKSVLLTISKDDICYSQEPGRNIYFRCCVNLAVAGPLYGNGDHSDKYG